MTERQNWIVVSSGDRPIQQLASDLADAGFTVEETLTEIGCISGTADADAARRARAIRGVADVSPAPPQSGIGPPGSDVVW